MDTKIRRDTTRNDKHHVNTTFHVTNHGIDDLQVFGTHRDKREFIACLQRHLTRGRILDRKRRPYKKLFDQVTLIAFCIMDDHFHLVLHQETAGGMARFMRTVQSGYGAYFNTRRGRKGPLFMQKYSATPIFEHEYAKRAVAYVHLNHEEKLLDYQYSSHDYFVGRRRCDWIDTDRGLKLFGGVDSYERYLCTYGPGIIESKRLKRVAKLRPA
jgi:REP element-mobilizing transposase RayT